MTKTILLISVFTICFAINNGYCRELSAPSDSEPDQIEHKDAAEIDEDSASTSIWRKIWGKKARNAVLAGMWSLHLDGTGEYFGDGRNNDQNHLIGLQYWGLSAGTFINSKDDRAWYFGPAREVYSHNFYPDTRFDIGYKFGLLYGYGDDLENIGGMSVYAIASFGITWKRLGFDLGVLPVGILTGNFRFDIDF